MNFACYLEGGVVHSEIFPAIRAFHFISLYRGFMLTSLFTFFAHLHTTLPTEENLLGIY